MQESRTITQRSASNLALAFIMLPREKRDAMSALYAFCREVDDVADEESNPVAQRRAALADWREDIRRACEGGKPTMPTNREFQPVIQRYHLPLAMFEEIIAGCEMDLEKTRYADFNELASYCYKVASAVGLLSIQVFGYKNQDCTGYATHLGHALQLTNILRDVGEDARRGRIYLPLSELAAHGVKESEILAGQYSSRYRDLAVSVAAKACYHYRLANELLPAEDRRSMVAAELMGAVYWELFRKLELAGFNVFGPRRLRLSKLHKLAIIGRMWFKHGVGLTSPNYGMP